MADSEDAVAGNVAATVAAANASDALELEQRMRAAHIGHEAMHSEMLLVIVLCSVVFQIVLVLWRRRHQRSFEAVSLLGMWLGPMVFSVVAGFWRMVVVWLMYTTMSAYVIWRASQRPLATRTPRLCYKWFFFMYRLTLSAGIFAYSIMIFDALVLARGTLSAFGQTLLFYSLYYGVLSCDFGEYCSERIASQVGYYSSTGLPKKKLDPSICAICGDALHAVVPQALDLRLEDVKELSCGHRFHEFCIRGWCMIGKKQTCPYCKERVDLQRVFPNPWRKHVQLYVQLLDMMRHLLVWTPVIVISGLFVIRLLGLK